MAEYSKDLGQNLKDRIELCRDAKDNKFLQQVEIERCRQSVLYFFNMYVWTYDPRRPLIKNIPFITYPFQDETILWDKQCAEDQEDNLVEKSRDTGCTWMFCTNDIHDWLFKKEKVEIRWGSRKEQYVDTRGDMDSIFEKFRHILKKLPLWMLPEGFDWKEHDNAMRLINPETGSSITGESSNANFGRGGRKYRIRFDELAFWDNDEAAWKACADTTNCRTAISTPDGASNKFAKLAKSDINKKALHWTQHPLKNKGVYRLDVATGEHIPIDITEDPDAAYKIWLEVRLENPPADLIGGLIRSVWYDRECERRKSVKEVAEELDIDYARSGSPFFDLRMLKRQIPWTVIYRQNFSNIIPYGRHIKVSLIEVDHKIEMRENRMGWLRVFEMPVKGNQYVLSGDTSEGLAKGDESFLVVREKWSRNVVAAGNGLWDPDDFAFKLQKVGALYNKCQVAPENNNHGFSVCSDLKQMDCHLYWTRKYDKKHKKWVPTKAGFTTTAQSRPTMLDQAREEIKKMSCEIRDPVIISQMGVFVHNEKNGKPEAIGEFLDDGVISYSIGGQVIKEYPYTPPTTPRARANNQIPSAPRHFRFGKK